MLRFVLLGLGLAVVNEFCRLPRGLVGRPLGGLPQLHYFLLHRPGVDRLEHVLRLKKSLLESAARATPHAAGHRW